VSVSHNPVRDAEARGRRPPTTGARAPIAGPPDETMKEEDVPSASEVTHEQLDLRVDGVGLTVATARRGGDLAPIVFLHGFGSTKEDYVDIAHQPAFTGRPFLAYDAPGCGETACDDLSKISIPFLMETAETVLQHVGIRRCHLVGHSMGGLTALMLAHQDPARVLSFINIEGNIAPEDCFLSRQIATHPSDNAESFLDDFIERTRRSPFQRPLRGKPSSQGTPRCGARNVRVDGQPVRPRRPDVEIPFAAMPAHVHVRRTELLPAVSDETKRQRRGTAEIPRSAHWPMYSNPVAMWERIAEFQSHNKLD
jgi:pimeloyl-ACP methyl ester carboxylesterase